MMTPEEKAEYRTLAIKRLGQIEAALRIVTSEEMKIRLRGLLGQWGGWSIGLGLIKKEDLYDAARVGAARAKRTQERRSART